MRKRKEGWGRVRDVRRGEEVRGDGGGQRGGKEGKRGGEGEGVEGEGRK